MTIKNKIIQNLINSYPDLDKKQLENLLSDNLFSPYTLKLKKDTIKQAQEAIKNIFNYRTSNEYKQIVQDRLKKVKIEDPHNYSLFMSYDFHLDENGNLKIIEINTNAAFEVLGTHFYQSQELSSPYGNFNLDQLKNCFLNEYKLNQKNDKSTLRVAIIDENPKEQKLYSEFLVTQALIKKWGWECDILDYRQIKLENYDLIYNRYTDFLFNGESSQHLHDAFNKKTICFSPNPYEYTLLADKERLIHFSQVESIKKYFPDSLILNTDTVDQIWSNRKKMFLKPLRSFGSKQTYKAASMSRRLFDEIKNQEFIAQEYVPAPEVEFGTPDGPQKFKYDLRFYAYMGEVQTVMARLYQGQVTNTRTPYGGFACVEVVD